jgi:hypothetical protein
MNSLVRSSSELSCDLYSQDLSCSGITTSSNIYVFNDSTLDA